MLLRCQHIRKSYMLGRTELPVLRGVDMSVRRGAFVSIVGTSGSGKSTLLHVLSGLDVPQRGQVYFENTPLFEEEGRRQVPLGRDAMVTDAVGAGWFDTGGGGDPLLENRRNQLRNEAFGFVFQFYHLLPEFDVLENVLLPLMVGRSVGGWLADRHDRTERAVALLQRVGLGDRMRHRPNELSGGERQRVAIARALINEPTVLFADEPTGNLDAQSGRGIFRLLKELNEAGQTLIMVTHDRDLADEADHVVHLVDGRVQ